MAAEACSEERRRGSHISAFTRLAGGMINGPTVGACNGKTTIKSFVHSESLFPCLGLPRTSGFNQWARVLFDLTPALGGLVRMLMAKKPILDVLCVLCVRLKGVVTVFISSRIVSTAEKQQNQCVCVFASGKRKATISPWHNQLSNSALSGAPASAIRLCAWNSVTCASSSPAFYHPPAAD